MGCRWVARSTTSTFGRAFWRGGLHPRRHPERVGGLLVVLVRPGAARRAAGHGPRGHLGHRTADVGQAATPIQFFQFVAAFDADYVSRDGRLVIDDPEIRQRLVKAIDSYTAIYRKGCTPPDSLTWADLGNNEAFWSGGGDGAERLALDPQRAQARAS